MSHHPLAGKTMSKKAEAARGKVAWTQEAIDECKLEGTRMYWRFNGWYGPSYRERLENGDCEE